MIQQFLNEDAEIRKVTDEATSELVNEYKQQTKEDLKIKDLKRRVDTLNIRTLQPVTTDEITKQGWTNLGGRTRKRRKTRKSRKSKKYRKFKKSRKYRRTKKR